MENNRRFIGSILFITVLCFCAAGCATTNAKDDPLKYTKKLVSEGHGSLYRNGAFQVPNTHISLIPPGPSTLEFVGELSGVRAKQSFETSVRNAADSVYVVSEGTKLTYKVAKNISRETNDRADSIRQFTRENSMLIVYRSSDLGKNIVGNSWDLSKETFIAGQRQGRAIITGSRSLGTEVSDKGTAQGMGLASGSLHAAKDISTASATRSGAALTYAGNAFVRGYVAVPSKMKKRAGEMGDSLTDAKFVGIVKESNETRKEWSKPSVDLMTDTVKNYTSDVSGSFKKAGQELSDSSTTGLSLAVLKSLRWVLQGILWDATIEPVTKMTAASVGYIGVNFVAFPSMVVVREGVATTKLAVEVSWNTAKMGYDIVAPTGVAAVAGVYGLLDFTGSHAVAGGAAVVGPVAGIGEAGLSKAGGAVVKGGGYVAAGATAAAGTIAGAGEVVLSKPAGVAVAAGGYVVSGATAVAGTVAGVGEAGLSQVSGVVIKGAGYAAGKGVQYIGVPLASAGIAVGGGTVGTVVGGVGIASGGALLVAGEAGGATTQVFGNTIAGTTLVAGTAASTAGGAAYGVYELSKAVVVPAGYELGGGIVLSYGTMSQLGAQTILAVSDCSYMVLSLEGPRWVLYAVKGKKDTGEDLPVGAVVDLKKMQETGEEIIYLPVSDQEMKKVVDSVYDNLPEMKSE